MSGYKLEYGDKIVFDGSGNDIRVQVDLEKVFVITPSGQRHSVSFLMSKLREAAGSMAKLIDDLSQDKAT